MPVSTSPAFTRATPQAAIPATNRPVTFLIPPFCFLGGQLTAPSTSAEWCNLYGTRLAITAVLITGQSTQSTGLSTVNVTHNEVVQAFTLNGLGSPTPNLSLPPGTGSGKVTSFTNLNTLALNIDDFLGVNATATANHTGFIVQFIATTTA